MTGDICLTPFYNIYDCMKKVEGYVKELNDGESLWPCALCPQHLVFG